jgi:hypothetical protein
VSCGGSSVAAGLVLASSFFFLELRVWRGESSNPIPCDQACALEDLSVRLEEEGPGSMDGTSSCLPRYIGKGERFFGSSPGETDEFNSFKRVTSSSSKWLKPGDRVGDSAREGGLGVASCWKSEGAEEGCNNSAE